MDQREQVRLRHDPHELAALHDEDRGLVLEEARGLVDAHVGRRHGEGGAHDVADAPARELLGVLRLAHRVHDLPVGEAPDRDALREDGKLADILVAHDADGRAHRVGRADARDGGRHDLGEEHPLPLGAVERLEDRGIGGEARVDAPVLDARDKGLRDARGPRDRGLREAELLAQRPQLPGEWHAQRHGAASRGGAE